MSTAYENLRKHLLLAIRQLQEIKSKDKPVDETELCNLCLEITDLVTDVWSLASVRLIDEP